MWRSIVMWVGGTHYNQAPMPEWSKGVDLRPTIVKIRAFEPRSVQFPLVYGLNILLLL